MTPLLLAGRTYFLEARTIGQADGLWFLSLDPRDQLALDVYRVNDGPWKTGHRDFAAAFRVSGDLDGGAVPEPASLVLFGTGLALAGLRRRGRLTPWSSD